MSFFSRILYKLYMLRTGRDDEMTSIYGFFIALPMFTHAWHSLYHILLFFRTFVLVYFIYTPNPCQSPP